MSDRPARGARPVRRTVVPHPTEGFDRGVRGRVTTVTAVSAVVAFAVLSWASARMERVGSSYGATQLSGSELAEVLTELAEVHRWVLVAGLADVVFAAAFGATLVLVTGLVADRVASGMGSDGASFGVASAFAVSSWLALGYTTADLVENHLVLGALWRSAQGSSVGVLGEWVAALGVVKYGCLLATFLVPGVSWVFLARLGRRSFSAPAW